MKAWILMMSVLGTSVGCDLALIPPMPSGPATGDDEGIGPRPVGGPRPDEPAAIEFTEVPPKGLWPATVRGVVRGVDPATHKVVTYIQVEGRWWVKRFADRPLSIIGGDNTFSSLITTGGVDQRASAVCSYVVPNGFPAALNTRPDMGEVLASVSVER